MTPDLELLTEALGGEPVSWEPVNKGGYTQSQAWRVTTAGDVVFVKQAEEAGSLHMLRREAAVYRGVRGPFLPAFVGFADSGARALLAIELLEDAHWPPPYPEDVTPLFDALERVASSEPPADLPAETPNESRWERVADDLAPFLALGLCSGRWFDDAVDTLVDAERNVVVVGDDLVHNDVYSANVAFAHEGAVLVDWGAAVRGSRWIDVAFAVLSLRVEGVARPAFVEIPGEASLVATIAGHFAVSASSPLPAWADPGSTFLEDMRGDLAHLLQWCVGLLELPPLS